MLQCANSSINFSVTDTNSSRTSEAALWPSTYISPLSNSTPCIRKDRISSKSLMRLSICLWKPSIDGYDVDGTDQTSLGQFSGRVQQTYKHSVPRFFVPEHGTMFTLALVRFPPTATKEIQYLNAKGALTYTDIAGDPVLYGN